MTRREFTRSSLAGLVGWALAPSFGSAADEPRRPLNILLFTADDLGPDTVGVGCLGGKVPGLTPNLDRFASRGLRFRNAHVNSAICAPSRGCLATGRYGFNSGVYGFMKTERDVPTVMEVLGAAGYLTGVLGKVSHSTPKVPYTWDYTRDYAELGSGRSPARYHACCTEFFAMCKKAGKPFYFMVNSHDPHRPFHVPGRLLKGAEAPSRLHKPAEIHVPGYLPDAPLVRQELSCYFNSVRRLDDTFGKVMAALREAGAEASTLVMFLSDNGIAVPFSKCNCYLASTRTPWLVRWPGVVRPGTVDDEHFISGIDFFPTALAAAGLPIPEGLDGRSFLPLLRGAKQEGRRYVFTQIDYKAGGAPVPMRCVQDTRIGYIFNAWSDGATRYRNNNEGLCMKGMVQAAETDPAIAERVKMFRYRAPEELYDLERDPDCLRNLVASAEHQEALRACQKQLREWMVASGDPLLATFDKRADRREMKAEMGRSYRAQCPPKRSPRKGPRGARKGRAADRK